MKRRSAGYTLLEVLIAFAIMTSVLAVLLPGQTTILRHARAGEDAFLATAYAQSRLDRLGIADPLEIGRSFDKYRKWNVETQVTQIDETPSTPGYTRVSILVRDQSDRLLARIDTVKDAIE